MQIFFAIFKQNARFEDYVIERTSVAYAAPRAWRYGQTEKIVDGRKSMILSDVKPGQL